MLRYMETGLKMGASTNGVLIHSLSVSAVKIEIKNPESAKVFLLTDIQL